jgi:metal-sulfur cluster biosynthetic enzyme
MSDAPSPDRGYVLDALHEVIDPELGYNIVDLGLIYSLDVNEGVIKITMTMTTPGCPAQDYIMSGVYERSRSLPGVTHVEIDLVWEPRWSPKQMSPVARAHFGVAD